MTPSRMNARRVKPRPTQSCLSVIPRGVYPVLALVAAQLTGCYHTANVVVVPALKTDYPVSASSQYLDASGAVVTDADYEVLHEFAFDKTVSVPMYEHQETPLSLEPELNRLVAEDGGTAITDVTIGATNYDPGSHATASLLSVMGWSFVAGAGVSAGIALSLDDPPELRDVMWFSAAALGVLGLAGVLAGNTQDDPSVWTLHIQGRVVRAASGPQALSPCQVKDNPMAFVGVAHEHQAAVGNQVFGLAP